MENFTSKEVLSHSNLNNFDHSDDRWKSFFRQAFVASGCCCFYFSMGILFGAPTVFIPQLRRANITVTDNVASWLSSTVNYSGVPWIVIDIILAETFGRRRTAMFVSFVTISGFVVFFFSKTTTHLLITEVMFGPTQGAAISITIIMISEYTSPKYRGTFLCLKSASALWGMWVSNAIGTFVFWRYIPVAGFVAALWTLTICFWPESPHWLANKSRFAECRTAHRWLKGNSKEAEMELEQLIQSQIQRDKILYFFKDFRLFTQREFFVPLVISLLAVILYVLCGKFVISIYAIDILKKITKKESDAYCGMLILDGVTVFSAYAGSYMVKLFKRRAMLLSTTTAAIFFLLALSLYLYLVKLSIVSENVWVSIILLSGFSVCISSGPMILSSPLYGELIPYRYKNISIATIGLLFLVLHATFLKLSPMIFRALGMSGTFLFYGLGSGFFTFLLYLYLPETKDKTLLEIEQYFKDKKNVDEGRNLVA